MTDRLTIADVVRIFRLSDSYVRRAIKRYERGEPGGLPASRFGSAYRIDPAVAEAWFDACDVRQASSAPPTQRTPRQRSAARPRGTVHSLTALERGGTG